jgi:hypothetical protein
VNLDLAIIPLKAFNIRQTVPPRPAYAFPVVPKRQDRQGGILW